MIASLWTIEPAATEDGYLRARGIVSPEFVYHCDINNGYGKLPALTVIDPYGRFLYVAGQTANSIYAFQISLTNGSLTAVSGSPFTTNLNGPISLAADGCSFELIRNETTAVRSLSVRHPNILHLIRMFQVPGPFSLPRIKEINLPPLIRKNLLQIPR